MASEDDYQDEQEEEKPEEGEDNASTFKPFKAYPSIENSYREKFMSTIISAGLADPAIEWVATEKVHGANFSFVYDGETLQVAKRSAIINSGKFFNHPVIVAKYGEGVKKIYAELKAEAPQLLGVTVFGEIFGGGYPGVKTTEEGASLVQRGLHYAPWTDFYAFDILARYQAEERIRGEWLEFDRATALFKQNGFFYAEPLARGTLEVVLKCPSEFSTTIPARLGLPTIPNNQAEGVVLRTVKPAYLRTGERAIIKNKSPKFSEVAHKKARTPPAQLPAEKVARASQLAKIINGYINDNRLDSVISKIGAVTKSDMGKLISLLVKDALEDFKKDGYGDEYSALEQSLQKTVTRGLGANAKDLVDKYLATLPAS